MKTKILFAFVFLSGISFLNAQLKVTSNGNVGIGTLTPNVNFKTTIAGPSLTIKDGSAGVNYNFYNPTSGLYIADVSPSVGCTYSYLGHSKAWYSGTFTYLTCNGTFYNYSDERLKKNINSLNFDSNTFSQLNPVSYDYLDSVNTTNAKGKPRTLKYDKSEYPTQGFLAQEVQKIYPQLVVTDDSTGLLKIKTLEFIPILVKALQDQQAQIDALTDLVNKSNSTPKKVGANQTSSTSETDMLSYPVLDQNIPNPFNTTTTIGFYLPTNIGSASVYVYDMNGVQLKSYSISQRRKGNIIIQGSEFNAGMYLYALIADGKVIDTKRMILTK